MELQGQGHPCDNTASRECAREADIVIACSATTAEYFKVRIIVKGPTLEDVNPIWGPKVKARHMEVKNDEAPKIDMQK